MGVQALSVEKELEKALTEDAGDFPVLTHARAALLISRRMVVLTQVLGSLSESVAALVEVLNERRGG